jgi:glycosyltransferase involved in cell wall biosynthesis
MANKNLMRVFAALEQLDVKLRILGHLNVEQKAALKRHKLAFKNLRDLTQQEVVEAYRRSTLLLFPSTHEGFGMPIIEAQSLGIPVITSNREPMKSIAGDAALLVDPDDTEHIRLAVERLTRDVDLRHRLIKAGLANCQRFEAGAIANQYAELYRTVSIGATPAEGT